MVKPLSQSQSPYNFLPLDHSSFVFSCFDAPPPLPSNWTSDLRRRANDTRAENSKENKDFTLKREKDRGCGVGDGVTVANFDSFSFARLHNPSDSWANLATHPFHRVE